MTNKSKTDIHADKPKIEELSNNELDQAQGGATYIKIGDTRGGTLTTSSTEKTFEAWPSKWKVSSFDGKGNDQ